MELSVRHLVLGRHAGIADQAPFRGREGPSGCANLGSVLGLTIEKIKLGAYTAASRLEVDHEGQPVPAKSRSWLQRSAIQGPRQRQQMGVSDAAVAGRRSIPERLYGRRPVLIGDVLTGNDGQQIKQALENGEIVGLICRPTL